MPRTPDENIDFSELVSIFDAILGELDNYQFSECSYPCESYSPPCDLPCDGESFV